MADIMSPADRQQSVRPLFRVLVVEQLNQDQWHVTQKGRPVPLRSLEGAPGGVGDFHTVLCEANERGRLCGLPVVVQPLEGEARWLTASEKQAVASDPSRRPSLDQVMGLEPWDGAA